MKRQRRIALWGWYGHQNTGDDALAATLAWGLHQFLSPCVFDVLTRNPLVLPPEIHPRYITARRCLAGIQLRKRVLLSDLHVVGGGSSIHDRGRGLKRRLQLMRVGGWLGQKTAALSVSLGPFRTAAGQRLCRDLLRRSSLTWVRDRRSLELAQTLAPRFRERVVLSPDSAVLVDRIGLPEPALQGRRAGPCIVVAPCDYYRFYVGEHKAYLDLQRRNALAKALAKVCRETKAHVCLLMMGGSSRVGDLPACRGIADRLPADRVNIISYDPNPLHAYRVIERSDLVVGMRLHSLIYAFAAGVPFVALDYHPKVTDFLSLVGADLSRSMNAHRIDSHILSNMICDCLDRPKTHLVPSMSPAEARSAARAVFSRLANSLGSR